MYSGVQCGIEYMYHQRGGVHLQLAHTTTPDGRRSMLPSVARRMPVLGRASRGATPSISRVCAQSTAASAVEAPEAAARRDLAAAHALSADFGFDELVWNHISARVPGGFLVTPGDLMFDEVHEDDFVRSSPNNANVTSDVIHAAVYTARPDVGAIVHHHTTAVVAVACLPGGLRYLTQDASAFYGRVAYHEWEGLSDDYEECERLAAAVAGGANTVLMRHHGALTFGATVAEAWVRDSSRRRRPASPPPLSAPHSHAGMPANPARRCATTTSIASAACNVRRGLRPSNLTRRRSRLLPSSMRPAASSAMAGSSGTPCCGVQTVCAARAAKAGRAASEWRGLASRPVLGAVI